MRAPNFFIVGAPKCGTSALAGYLREHPQCFMCWPKEPLFFCEDLPGIRQIDDLPAYLDLFADAPQEARAIGEASAMYLYSKVAVERIWQRFGPVRIIVMLRNPIQLVDAFHAQLRYALSEDEPQLEAAWRLQGERARGRNIPAKCPEPKLLQYREVASLGEQIARLCQVVPTEYVHYVVFDDLARDPRAEYVRVLGFLDLDDDGRVLFPAVNPRGDHRVRWLSRLTQRPPRMGIEAARAVKRIFGFQRIGALDWIRRLNRKSARRREIPQEFWLELSDTLSEDVALLSSLLGRDFRPWLTGKPVPARNESAIG